MKFYLRELLALGFTVGGVGLVLITLAPGSSTFRWAVWIAAASLIAHMASVALGRHSDD
tara:strand:- start:1357 stop:1533 length:177 start_codon:yes stop_codon:yes gene_type:complete